MIGKRLAAAILATAALFPLTGEQARAQQVVEGAVLDSIAVTGNSRVSRPRIISQANLPTGQVVTFRDLQRAIEALYELNEFDDVRILQGEIDGRVVLRIEVDERPLLASWDVVGTEQLPDRSVRGRVTLSSGRAYDRSQARLSLARIDSLYRQEGYYQTSIDIVEQAVGESQVRVTFNVREGSRVAISEIRIEGNERFTDDEVVDAMATGTEGFLWFKKGEYDEDKLRVDLRQRLPQFYASRGYIDFRAVSDTLIVNESTGKGRLIIEVEEGPRYDIGSFEIVGNRQYSRETIERFYPFGQRQTGFLGLGGVREGPSTFDQAAWDEATASLEGLYYDNGYIQAQVIPLMNRRVDDDGRHLVDLRWQIFEGPPAVVNRVNIVGNTTTHENVIRRAIIMVPGDVFRRQALLRSYQNISNLNFFQQPLPFPDITPTPEGDVDITFRVEERNTGNINFGASVGQGTGLGGFIGLQQPNLFGRGKSASIQWQFGRNVSDINLSYTDPAIRGSLISGSISLHNTRLRFTVGDLGRVRKSGGSVRIGWPFFGSRFTRMFASYTLEESDYDSETLAPRFNCANCVLSQFGLSISRDTRIDLPFATGGTYHEASISQTGGPMGGSGNFRRASFEGRWYAPIAQIGSPDPTGSTGNPIKFVLGFTAKSGFVWGDAGPHFRQLFSMGGTQFGIPLRGYEEFSITPLGFDPGARSFGATTVDAFGGTYYAMTGEIGIRFSQSVYLSTFMDAGNVWETPRQWNPTRLFRGAGMGLALLTPLGPIGLDYAYGFDRVDIFGDPDPGWKFHFKLGNFF